MSTRTATPQRHRSVKHAPPAGESEKSPTAAPSITLPDLLRLTRREADEAIAKLYESGNCGPVGLTLTAFEERWLLEAIVCQWETMRECMDGEAMDDYEVFKGILAKLQSQR
jgi:hypothetical protein